MSAFVTIYGEDDEVVYREALDNECEHWRGRPIAIECGRCPRCLLEIAKKNGMQVEIVHKETAQE